MAVSESDFRTCTVTGLKVHRPAEKLIIINAVTAVVFLLVGGILALLIALTRWPAVHLLPPELFYRLLTLHPVAMLVAWIVFFEIAILYFTSAVLLNSRLAAPKLAWLAYILMIVGGAIAAVVILLGKADVMFTSYPPLKANPLFYLGYILFAVGALLGCGIFFGTLVVAKTEKTYEGSIPLVTFGAMAAAIIAVFTLASGAIILIPTFLWSVGILNSIDPATYRLIFWGFGHSTQQINVCAMIATWYALATLTVGAKPLNQKICRTAFVFYLLFIDVAAEHHLLTDPVFTHAHKIFNTGYVLYLAVFASLIHALAVPASVEVALRKKGYTKGLFEWLKKAPWGEPGFSALVFSVLGFGFLGGISGVTFGTEQISLVAHNTWRMTGHFHGTVVAGTTLAFMGLTYYVIPLIARRQIVNKKLASIQPYLYGIGMMIQSASMMAAGSYGIPRRHWDITFSQSLFSMTFDPTAFMWVSVFALGSLIAVLGGAIFIYLAVASLLFGKKLP